MDDPRQTQRTRHTEEEIRKHLSERILVLDGAMGTRIQSYKLGEADYRGERFKDWESDLAGNNDLLVLCLLYTSPSPRDGLLSRMPSSA